MAEPPSIVDILRDEVEKSFRRKLAASLLVVFLVITLATAGLYIQIGAVLDDSVEQSMTTAANVEANELEEWTTHYRLFAQLLAAHPVYDEGDQSSIREYLQERRHSGGDGNVRDVYIVDRKHQTVRTATDRSLEGTAVRDLPWEERFAFRDFDDVVMTDPYRDDTGAPVVAFITPIRRMPGSLLVVEVATSGIFGHFEHPVDGGFTRVVNSNGTVVFADDGAAVLTQYLDDDQRASVVNQGLRGESGFSTDPAYGTDGTYVAAYAAVPNTDWVVVDHAPTNEAYLITQRAQTWIAGITTLTLLAMFVVVGTLGTDVRRALSRVRNRANRIAGGEYDVSFDTEREDEFGDLNRALAVMRDRLRARIEELQETKAELTAANRELEDRSTMVDVLNRILRHNVRNEINVIEGRAALATARSDDEAVTEHLRHVESAATDLAELSDRTQRIRHLISEASSKCEPIALESALEPTLETVETTHSSATVELTAIGDPVAKVPSTLPDVVSDVVEEIVTANPEGIRVDVVAREAETGSGEPVVTLEILDDANGLPQTDVRAVETGEEVPLNHAQGLALWYLSWTVSKADGHIDVDPDDTTLEIRLPGFPEEQ